MTSSNNGSWGRKGGMKSKYPAGIVKADGGNEAVCKLSHKLLSSLGNRSVRYPVSIRDGGGRWKK